MGKVLDCIGPAEESFISKQKVFFVGTAPLSQDGHVNISPKAPGSSVVVIDKMTVAYADLSGSGAETAAHITENQRMVLLFCNIEAGAPKLLRIHGKASVVIREHISGDLLKRFPKEIVSSYGFRAVYILKADRISSSCGYSMPVMTFQKYRSVLSEFTEKQGRDGMREYGIKKNSYSIDGLPSVGMFRHEENNDSKTTRIVPNPEDGYIFGKLAPRGENGNGSVTHYHVPAKKTKHAWNWSSFACGVVLGAALIALQFALVDVEELGKRFSEIGL